MACTSRRPAMSTSTQLLALLAVAAIPVAPSGCQQLQCAPGTNESNGQCVPANEVVDNGNCGPGTVLGNDGMCVPEIPPTECDPNTTTPEPCADDPSVICCVGTGGGGCSTDIA